MPKKSVIFLINLLQDVNIVRPLAYMAARDLDAQVEFMLSYRFLQRDTRRNWQHELALISGATNAQVHIYSSPYEAAKILSGKFGLLIAASESNLSAHADTHNVFRIAPQDFIKITLQHGFECVGFLQNREHNIAHGTSVRFAADVLCGWFDVSHMRSMAQSERQKLVVTGPSAALQQPPSGTRKQGSGGIVCENLHSVRLSASGDFKASFMDIFFQFCAEKARKKEKVILRPHPGGQYVVKNKIILPPNVELNNRPIYKVDISAYDFGVSAPSSIIIDMLLSRIPVGVWSDDDGVMDTSNYSGLTPISKLEEWLTFSKMAVTQRDVILQRQERFLERTGMPYKAEDVRGRFLRLLSGGVDNALEVTTQRAERQAATVEKAEMSAVTELARSKRILFVANANIPTYQLSFVKPLKSLVDAGHVTMELLSDDMLALSPKSQRKTEIKKIFENFEPDLVVFCRYSGPYHEAVMELAKQSGCTTIYHVDDDLLNIPVEIGIKKHEFHNRTERLTSVSDLMDQVDLIYCSTVLLKRRLENYGFRTPIIAGDIYCSGSVLSSAVEQPVTKVGYMGFDHAHDLEMILPQLVIYLRDNKHVRFELFGSIPLPEELKEFGDRITLIEPVRDYAQFLQKFSELGWHIGICPLQNTDFNRVKANTKWVEYTSIGAAVIASRGLMYNSCCYDNCGILAETETEWLRALNHLTKRPDLRYQMVLNAQAKLNEQYSVQKLRRQVCTIFGAAHQLSETNSKIRATAAPRERILVISDAVSATQEISFRQPLLPLDKKGDIALSIVEDNEALHVEHKFKIFWKRVQPTVVIFSRFVDASDTLAYAQALTDNIPIIFHIDDNLFKVPDVLGSDKVLQHNDPKKLERLRATVNGCNLIYASTARLREALLTEKLSPPIYAGQIYRAASESAFNIYNPAETPVIGYMGTGSHIADMELFVPALDKLMTEFPNLRFEAFGSITMVSDFSRYGDRYASIRRTNTYDEFIVKLATLGWWGGLAPLEDHAFNLCKADTKWVEYSLSGIPVVTSDIAVYEPAFSDGGALKAGNVDDWYEQMRRLITDRKFGAALVDVAQEKLLRDYPTEKLAVQILDVIDAARAVAWASRHSDQNTLVN